MKQPLMAPIRTACTWARPKRPKYKRAEFSLVRNAKKKKGGSGALSIKKVSLFVVVFFMSMFTIHNVSASQRFVDVPSSHGAYEEINYLVDLGVIKGYTENGKSYYKPNNYVTRGQAAKMVVESTGHEPLVVSKSSFSDIKPDLYPELSGYVESAV